MPPTCLAEDPVLVLSTARPYRLRSDGVLDAAALQQCRTGGVPLAYDPVQGGWLPADVVDDLDDWALPLSAALAPAGRFRFRPWRPEEAALLRALLDDPLMWRHLPEPYPAPVSEALAGELIAVSALGGHHEVLAAEADDAPVGQMRLLFGGHGADRGEAELSYWLGRAQWGQGLGRALVAEATALAFARHPGLGRLTARVHPENAASARALVHAGFRDTGAPLPGGWHLFERPRG
jgi:RimJ/RimL family protein N-acetyltransferase